MAPWGLGCLFLQCFSGKGGTDLSLQRQSCPYTEHLVSMGRTWKEVVGAWFVTMKVLKQDLFLSVLQTRVPLGWIFVFAVLAGEWSYNLCSVRVPAASPTSDHERRVTPCPSPCNLERPERSPGITKRPPRGQHCSPALQDLLSRRPLKEKTLHFGSSLIWENREEGLGFICFVLDFNTVATCKLIPRELSLQADEDKSQRSQLAFLAEGGWGHSYFHYPIHLDTTSVRSTERASSHTVLPSACISFTPFPSVKIISHIQQMSNFIFMPFFFEGRLDSLQKSEDISTVEDEVLFFFFPKMTGSDFSTGNQILKGVVNKQNLWTTKFWRLLWRWLWNMRH